jgi:hypothetical protein
MPDQTEPTPETVPVATPVTTPAADAAEQRPFNADVQRVAPNSLKRYMDRINDRNANRQETPPVEVTEAAEQHFARAAQQYQQHQEQKQMKRSPGESESDPSGPVHGPLELIEEIIAITQRFGHIAHWPTEKKTYALAMVTRTVKQMAIADRVYRERRRLAREAATLVRAYFGEGEVTVRDLVEGNAEPYVEAINYLGRFAKRVAEIPDTPGEDETPADGGL